MVGWGKYTCTLVCQEGDRGTRLLQEGSGYKVLLTRVWVGQGVNGLGC